MFTEKIQNLIRIWQQEYDDLNKSVHECIDEPHSDRKYLKLSELLGARQVLGIKILELKSLIN